MFQETELSHISGNGSYIKETLKTFLHFRRELPRSKNKITTLKNLLTFREMGLSCPKNLNKTP